MKEEFILQKKYTDWETLYIFKDGRIICDCLNGLWNKDRDVNSICRHEKDLRIAISKGDISEYWDVTPK
jgi:hypothetical protein